jgi:tight adherence protein C
VNPFAVPLLAALAATGLVVLSIVGTRLLRTDPLDTLDVADLALVRPSADKAARRSPLAALGRRLAPALATALGAKQRAALARRLELAGNPETLDQHLQRRARFLAVFGTTGVALVLRGNVLPGLAVLVASGLLPELGLRATSRARQHRIEVDLPDFLDVLAVTVNAGLSFRSALDRVARRHRGPLAEELLLTLRQMDVGESRQEAFARMRQRNDSQSLSAFVTALLQAEELGSPITEALDQIAREMRRAASQAARRRAARAAPRVTLVVTLVMMPGTLALLAVAMFLSSGVDLGGLLSNG